jgi:hypothetical protein
VNTSEPYQLWHTLPFWFIRTAYPAHLAARLYTKREQGLRLLTLDEGAQIAVDFIACRKKER